MAKKTISIFTSVIIVSSILTVSITFTKLGIQINHFLFTNPAIELNPDAIPELELIPRVEIISINGNNFTFEIYLWRDFMPPSPPDGKELRAVVTLYALNFSTFPTENFTANQMWVFYKGEIWNPKFEFPIVSYKDSSSISMSASGGPKWGPGVYVNVTLEVIYNNLQNYNLTAFNQYIEATF